jgi:hypothetical protein
MARRLSALLLAGAAAGAALLLRRRGLPRRERVDLYYADGSMVSLEGGSPEAARLLELGREALTRARG